MLEQSSLCDFSGDHDSMYTRLRETMAGSDNNGLKNATEKISESIQSLQQAQICGKEYFDENKQVKSSLVECLDALKVVKKSMETAHNNSGTVSGPCISPGVVDEVTKLFTTCFPWANGMSEEKKDKIYSLISKELKNSVREILFISVVSCPWYVSLFSHVEQRGRHNHLYVVYVCKDQDYFSPITYDAFSLKFVRSFGSIYLIEISEFANLMYRGSVRHIEAMNQRKTFIYEQEGWQNLFDSATAVRDMLVNQCCVKKMQGQALGNLVSKNKLTGELDMKPNVTKYELCESIRLLSYLNWLVNKSPATPIIREPSQIVDTADLGKECYELLKEETFDSRLFISKMVQWRDSMNGRLNDILSSSNMLSRRLGIWVGQTRKKSHDEATSIRLEPDTSQLDNLNYMLERLEKPPSILCRNPQRRVVTATRAGSYLYNLDVEGSDEDYIVIYNEDVEKVIADFSRNLKNIHENRGPQLKVEHGVYELGKFAEMLYKGSVICLEMVFSDALDYETEVWRCLTKERQKFVTEKAITQFMGVIRHCRNNLDKVKQGKSNKSANKLLYQMMHKLSMVKAMMKGDVPTVRLSGSERQEIMRIREANFEDAESRDQAIDAAIAQVAETQKALSDRSRRNPEDVDLKFFCCWIMTARGWKIRD